jgi:hypothetical protein
VCWLFAGWLGAQGILEVSKTLILGPWVSLPCTIFKLVFVATYGIFWELVTLLLAQWHKLFMGFC